MSPAPCATPVFHLAALVLEITESTLMLNFDEGLARLRSLKDLGLRIALDDYGTGYSSLNRLGTLPVDIVKIDKSFIDQLTASREGRALVQSVIDVAEALGMKSIAEGVERPDQYGALEELGCDYIQGYLFSEPTPPERTADTFRRLRAQLQVPNDHRASERFTPLEVARRQWCRVCVRQRPGSHGVTPTTHDRVPTPGAMNRCAARWVVQIVSKRWATRAQSVFSCRRVFRRKLIADSSRGPESYL